MSHVDEGTLHAYLDGELPSSERADVEAHLAECAECRANLAEAKALSSRASDILGRAAPAARPLPAMPRRRRLVRVPVAWAATVVLALGLGYYLHTPDSRTPAEEPSSVAMQSNRPAPAIAPAADRSRVQEPVRRRDVRSPRSRENVAAADKAPITMQPVPAGAAPASSTTELRGAAAVNAGAPPAAAPQFEDMVVRRDTALATLRGRLVSSQWTVISKGSARTLLGTDPVGIPGLAARDIRRSPTDAATIVVEQQLDSTTVIQLFQRVAVGSSTELGSMAPANAEVARTPAERLARYVGRLRVEIAGPLTQDSLNRLLEQVRPLP